MASHAKILLTGATGYVGGRLLPILEAAGHSVRCMTRRETGLRDSIGDRSEIVIADARDEDSLAEALEGIETAYYLIHSMGDSKDFAEVDRQIAENFARACTRSKVKRIIYLGGLGNPDHELSKHLSSRQEIGNVLRTSNADVIEFRASIIIGSGSLSFEMIRALVERLPVMICPKWVRVLAQPISIEDVLDYLAEALERPLDETIIFEIGGPDQLSYGEIMQRYAKQRGLWRLMIPVPLLTPYLSSLWLGLVTPLYSRVGRKLVDSLRNPTLVSNNVVDRYFRVRPRSTDEAIQRALINEDDKLARTRWSDAFSSGGEQKSWGGIRFGSRLVDSRTRTVDLNAEDAFRPIRRIGGDTGWYYGNWLWKIRGFLDLLVGGVGIRRGRRHPDEINVGETLDFWRVEAFEENRLLRLAAEMKVPGRAWLEFEVKVVDGKTTVRQTAIFDPVGLWGILYWYSLFPLHEFVFAGMLRNICKAAESTTTGSSTAAASADSR
ncbi:MAG: SDR family oxidoreductase [Planctomycetota bacterium]